MNREVGVLLKMLRLAFERSKLLRLPIVHKPKEAAAIAYTFGWRTQSEVLTLTRAQVDLEAGVLRLEPGMTKNDDGREVYMPPDLRRVVAGQVDRVKALERELERIIPHLFPSSQWGAQGPAAPRLPDGPGQRVQEDRGEWTLAA